MFKTEAVNNIRTEEKSFSHVKSFPLLGDFQYKNRYCSNGSSAQLVHYDESHYL